MPAVALSHRPAVRLATSLLALSSLLLLFVPAAPAEQERAARANYKQAFKYSAEYLKQFVYDTAVFPNWVGKTELGIARPALLRSWEGKPTRTRRQD